MIIHEIVVAVWRKGYPVIGIDPNVWRKDQCGAWIGWAYYGDRTSQYGWEIDHNKPVASGGPDDLINLRPLHWKNNARKQDGSLACAVIASN
jgi:hypothetical protein